MYGKVTIQLIDKITGKIKKEIKTFNTILTSGKNKFWELQDRSYGSFALKKIAIGDDNTTPDASQTSLGNEIKSEDGDVTRDGKTVTIQHTFKDWTSTYTIKEAGIKLSSGDLFNRVVFTGVTVDENNNIKIKFEVIVS